MGRKKIIFGLTGMIGSGKGTIADLLKGKGFFVTSISDSIREEIRSRGEEITREKMLAVADEMRQKEGPNIWVERIWQKVLQQGNGRAVIDSIRGEAEVDFLKKQAGFILIAVTAPVEVRFQRIKERGRESDPQTLEDFLKIEEKDKKSGEGLKGRNLAACMAKADFTIENIGTVEKLKKQIDKIIKIV